MSEPEPDDFPELESDFVERLEGIDDGFAEQQAASLRAGLEVYDLDDEDLQLLDADFADSDEPVYLPALPVIAIVGRPNVGKSALVNRILGRREAVVEDVPGVTRDRVSYKGDWLGRRFTLVDTGGWEPDARGIDASVAAQAEVAIELCDVVLFVVDAMVGATATDEHVVKLLRRTNKPVFLVANKVDDPRQEPEAAALWSLGLGEPGRSVRCTAAGLPICWRTCSRCCRKRARWPSANSAVPAGWRLLAARTLASRAC